MYLVNALLNGLLSIITTILNIFLLPVNALLTSLFPDMTNAINVFNDFITHYLGTPLAFFFGILPPIFRGLLSIWFTFIISYYSIYYTYIGIIKIWNIIQKLKFW